MRVGFVHRLRSRTGRHWRRGPGLSDGHPVGSPQAADPRRTRARGVGARQFDRQRAAGALRQVHRGAYVRKADWDGAFTEERHLLRVIAAVQAMRGSATVASHTSAAVANDLPLFRLQPRRVHFTGAATAGLVTTNGDIARHRVDVPLADRSVEHGIPCTSLSRTVFDVVRGASEETGLALADAAFRRVAWDAETRRYDPDAADEFRAGLQERIARAPGGRGIRRARRIIALADGRAQLPGESVSRLYLLRLGFAVPRLQVPVPAPSGRDYQVDFGIDDAPAWGEFDGEGKYTDPALMSELGCGVIAREKEREDWIRGTTQRPMARWGMRHVDSEVTLGNRLATFSVRPPD